MKFLDEPSTFIIFFFQRKCRQVQRGQRHKRILGLMRVLLFFLCLAPVKPTLAEDGVWTSKIMTVLVSANNQYDPPGGTPRQSTDLPAFAFVYTPYGDGGAMSSALSGGPGRKGGTLSVLSKAKAWGNFYEHYVVNEAGSNSGFLGTFVSSHTDYFLCFDVFGWGNNTNLIQVLDPNGTPPLLLSTINNVPLGGKYSVIINVKNPSYPERKANFIAGSSAINIVSNPNDSFCQITPQILKEIILATLPNGVKIIAQPEPGGIRIKRVKKVGQSEWSHYIAGCYYDGGKNDYGQIRETNGFRWTNMKPGAVDGEFSIVDVYKYDGDTDKVTKIEYLPDPANNKDAKKVYEESSDLISGDFLSGLRWSGDPQTDSNALFTVPLASEGQTQKPLAVVDQATSEAMTSAVFVPRSTLTCYGTNGGQWSYGLAVSDFTGGLVSPGDRIVIEGSGIAGGSVGSKAATTAYGAWVVKDVSGGKIVFEATVGARFTDMADGFMVNGKKGARQGELNYRNLCNFIGGAGQVPGPVKSDIVPMLMLLLGD